MATRLLPDHPHLDQLKRQAKELLHDHRAGDPAAFSLIAEFLPPLSRPLALADAQHAIARRYSFRSWAKLKEFIDTYDASGVSPAAARLRQAIDADQIALMARLLDDEPELIDEPVARAKIRYRNQRPLTYACQSNHPRAVALLLERGADPAADGYLAVARASMNDGQLPCLELLFARGLDPNLEVYDWGPLLLYPCECLAPGVIRFLLERGADPNRSDPQARCTQTPLAMVMDTYARSPAQARCLEALIAGGARFEDSPVMDVHRNRLDALARRLDAEPGLVHRRFPGLDYGRTAHRGLTASGGTLLHVAAEFCVVEVARLLLSRGADVDARAEIDADGHGGQTPLFHAASHYHDWGVEMVGLLLEHRTDTSTRCTLRGHIEHPGEYVSCTALGYAQRFPPERADSDPTLALLRGACAPA